MKEQLPNRSLNVSWCQTSQFAFLPLLNPAFRLLSESFLFFIFINTKILPKNSGIGQDSKSKNPPHRSIDNHQLVPLNHQKVISPFKEISPPQKISSPRPIDHSPHLNTTTTKPYPTKWGRLILPISLIEDFF